MALKTKSKSVSHQPSTRDVQLSAMMQMHSDYVELISKSIEVEQSMHKANLDSTLVLLSTALKSAETVEADNFSCLIDALKEVAMASIQAQKEVALANADNGRAFIKVLDNAVQAGIAVAAAAMRDDDESLDDFDNVRDLTGS